VAQQFRACSNLVQQRITAAEARSYLEMLEHLGKLRVGVHFVATHDHVTPSMLCGRLCCELYAAILTTAPRGAPYVLRPLDDLVEAASRAAGSSITRTQAQTLHHLLDRDRTELRA